MSKAKIRVYGCGGAGINQTKPFLGQKPTEGYAQVDVAFVDTSRSNIDDTVSAEHIYILPNVDGSGKKRAENHVEIANTVKDVLIKQKPAEFNIVIYSGAGGSGSVYGPLIVKELMASGVAVLSIVIGNTSTAIEAENTMKTLKTLDHFARTLGVPAVVNYHQNTKKNPRRKVDETIFQIITALSLLTSRENAELDTADVTNWLRYHNVSDVPAQLAMMDVVTDEETAKEIIDPVSVASILDVGTDPVIEFSPDYGCVGYKGSAVSTETPEIHYVIAINAVPELYAFVAGLSSGFDEAKAARPTQQKLVDDKKDNVTDSGLIL
jgi:cell division GTPase FtsZ